MYTLKDTFIDVVHCKFIMFNTHRFSNKSADKLISHRFYQTCLIIVGGESVKKIGDEVGRHQKKKFGRQRQVQLPCHTHRFFS